MLQCILGNIYPFTMPGPPGELMTKKNKYFLRVTADVIYLWVCDKLVLSSEFQHEGSKQTKKNNKKTQLLSKILWLSWQEQIQKIKLFKYYKQKNKIYLDKILSLGQEPTFKVKC